MINDKIIKEIMYTNGGHVFTPNKWFENVDDP